ncbi:MAG: calcium-translocating P-type ATPase, PMCA-type [Thomasclavelia sp.]|nr:calcium-translocating P-type ATPase, PMCA-type [Thomasclavelia sp.]
MYYNQSIEELEKELDTDLKNGLTTTKVNQRLLQNGPNELEKEKKDSLIKRFILQFKDALTIILIIAAIVSIVVQPEDWVDSAIIIFVVVVNAILGLVQENNAEKSLEALQNMASPKAKVIRDGNNQVIESKDLVVGDIVLLDAGDCVSSDARLIEAFNLKLDESALTGESVPVDKNINLIEGDDVPLGDRTNMVYSSCNVTYGRGVGVVVTTGKDNEVGKIATMLTNSTRERTPLQGKLDQIGKSIGVICVVICIIVFGMELFTGLSVIDAFETAVALAVAAIPEGLATVVTIVLALSVSKMAKENAIVKSLPAVETLGCTSIVCSDKTGTLTQNKMTVVKTYLNNKDIEPLETSSKDTDELLRYFSLCSDGSVEVINGVEENVGDPTETALVKAAMDKGYPKSLLNEKYPRFNELSFDSDRKMMSVFVKHEGQIISITKGGPDVIFSRCNNIDLPTVEAINEKLSNDALRVLALAIKIWDKEPEVIDSEHVENDLTFIGLVGMIDPPREEAKKAVLEAKKAGVRTIMITGDHIVTASAIAKSLGIMEPGQKAIMGSELNNMSDEEFDSCIEDYAVYARVAPEHKVRIVNGWKSKNKVVAMTGDGVNDSPALKAADIGCAMGITGSDVAKGAASMILTDDNFATIIRSIKEGRGIYDNIRKCVEFLLSSNIGEVITIFVASLLSVFNPTIGIPLLPIHLLWVNLITDSLPAFALGLEPVEEEVMERKPRGKDESFFSGHLGVKIAIEGIMIGALTLTSYLIGNSISHPTGMTMAFITLCGCQLVHAFNVKSSHSILNKTLFNNPYLWGALAAGLFLQVIIITIPELSSIFKLERLHLNQWLICVGLSLCTVVFLEIYKFIVRKKSK